MSAEVKHALQMLELPPDNKGLDFIAASKPQKLLLIPGLLPASITAAALGDQQAAAYLRFTAQHFAAFNSPDRDALQVFCVAAALQSGVNAEAMSQRMVEAAAALSSSLSKQEVVQSMTEPVRGQLTTYTERQLHTTLLLTDTAESGMLAELKWLRALCISLADVEALLMGISAQEGHLEMLKYLRTGPNPAPWGTASECAVRHPECLRWLLDSGCPCYEETLSGLAREGDLETLKWVFTHPKAPAPMSLWSTDVTAAAAQGGSLALLQWLRAPPLSVPWDTTCTKQAARRGDLPMLQWMRGEDPPCPWNATCFANAASCGSLPLLQWLRSQGAPWDETLCMRAAGAGNLDVLHWACSQQPPAPFDCRSMCAAATKPSMDCLIWLHAHGAPCEASCCVAAVGCDLSVLKWLRKQDPPAPFNAGVSRQAAQLGDLATLKWLHDEGCPIDGTAYLGAAVGAELGRPVKCVLRWLHDQGVPAPAEPPLRSLKDVQILLFMADKGFLLESEHCRIVRRARRRCCTFHGLLRWFCRALSDPTCGAHRAFSFFAASSAGQDLLVRLCQLPAELVTRIAVAADLQQDII